MLDNISTNFIKKIVIEDLENKKHNTVITRFPPEPNGYLHIGHAKSIVLNFDLADEFGGITNLRFDDTNPIKEDEEYVESIKNDIEWLGYKWENLYFASDYFDEMYERAVILIKKGLAFVDDLSADEIRKYRGTLTEAGKESPYRNRNIEENLKLFNEMKNGIYKDGEKVLRAKIDMSSGNINMRDPVIYRILHSSHHQTGDKWCIYPMYDYAHPIEDAVEGITHSICTLEFEDHRPFYDWVVKECEMELIPRQIEFARLAMTDTVMSKRYLKMLVDEKIADGWDDPRLPTVSGLRRRGYTKEAIKEFVRGVGVSKSNSIVDGALLDHYIREDLKLKVNRTMAVIDPLKVIIENYPDNEVEYLDVENNQENELSGTRKVPFSKEIYIERDDFSIDPPKGYKRLTKENEVRLKNAYFIKLKEIIFNEDGSIKELIVTYDPKTKSGSGFDERKPKGTIHWVDKNHCVPATFNLYEPIMLDSIQSDNFMDRLNPNSHFVLNGFVEENIKGSEPLTSFQFFRHGYFTVDSKHSTKEKLVFNRIVSLKSSF